MTKRMLIDATHAEETRVVILDGTKLEDFDVETSTKKQIKGNIYLAKVIRVEPSLQAAFVEYGGNRHGFLAFGEIHPDYYQIPVADRQRLLEIEAAELRAEEEAEAAEEAAQDRAASRGRKVSGFAEAQSEAPIISEFDAIEPAFEAAVEAELENAPAEQPTVAAEALIGASVEPPAEEESEATSTPRAQPAAMARDIVISAEAPPELAEADLPSFAEPEGHVSVAQDDATEEAPENIGGAEGNDGGEEAPERRQSTRFMRNYKIQEVIHRRQIMLIQVVKEERGNKGAALTSYLSLAGRYCVLMPNSPRGGGVSRKITSLADRKRLREVIKEVDMPAGMGMIVRTAGANRPKPEIRRDCEYLLRLWDDIRDHTLQSVAPSLIYEEASLIKRAIRDGYTGDIEEVLVDGEAGWKAARDFMRMLTPQHVSKVQLWRDSDLPLFAKHQVELQLDAMMSPTVQLKSGGYLVINQAEALVAVDVNSGRSTRERNVEETALRTNLEAADEAARQFRLRDLAGLIVIDFIDMESRKHNAMVERRLKEALKNDRARIQIGQISHFGLLEMSRQRLRPSLAETAFVTCPHCLGLGHVRSVESSAIHVLRALEEEAARRRASELQVHLAGAVAMYILNFKRERLAAIERIHGIQIILLQDESLLAPQVRIERSKPYVQSGEAPQIGGPIAMNTSATAVYDTAAEDEAGETAAVLHSTPQSVPVPEAAIIAAAVQAQVQPNAQQSASGEEGQERRRRRRRRRRGGRREEGQEAGAANNTQPFQGEGEFQSEGGFESDDEEDGDLLQAADPTPAPQEPAIPPISPDEPSPGPRDPGVPPLPDRPVPGPGPEIPERPGREPELPVPNGPGPEIPGDPSGPGPDIMPPIGPSPEMPQPVAMAETTGGRRRRSSRGGGRRSEVSGTGEPVPYRGPTPANPYAGQVDELFAALDFVPEPQPTRLAPSDVPEQSAVAAAEAFAADEASTADMAVAAESPAVETPEVAAPVADVVPAEAVEVAPVARKGRAPARTPRARKPKEAAAPLELLGELAPDEVHSAPAPRRRAAPRARAAAAPTPRMPSEEDAQLEEEMVHQPPLNSGIRSNVFDPAPLIPPDGTEAPASDPYAEQTERSAAPVIQPVVVGVDTVGAEKKRGWWKR
jgi:ribonuclease E